MILFSSYIALTKNLFDTIITLMVLLYKRKQNIKNVNSILIDRGASFKSMIRWYVGSIYDSYQKGKDAEGDFSLP